MCAIVDVNNCYKIFGNPEQRTPAGSYFLDWLGGESGRLILGGTKFNSEIGKVWDYVVWLKTATRTGHVHRVEDHLVDTAERELAAGDKCKSDDHHLIALARIGGARLLFSEDPDLHEDFRNPGIIANPRGRVYSTRFDHEVSVEHRRLLNPRYRSDMCAPHCQQRPR